MVGPVAPEVVPAVEPRDGPGDDGPPDELVDGFEPEAPVDLPVVGWADEPALPLTTIWLVTVAGPAVDADVQADSIRLTANPTPMSAIEVRESKDLRFTKPPPSICAA